jgi:hypothetical protein
LVAFTVSLPVCEPLWITKKAPPRLVPVPCFRNSNLCQLCKLVPRRNVTANLPRVAKSGLGLSHPPRTGPRPPTCLCA